MTNAAGLAVQLTESYAHRVGDAVHLVVQLSAKGAPLPEGATLLLQKGERVVPVPVSPRSTPTGTLVDATVPIRQLGPGTWTLALAEGSLRPTRLQARLVYTDRQPVALLTGPVPTTALAPPRPRAASRTARRRLSTVAAGARSRLRRAGRRLSG